MSVKKIVNFNRKQLNSHLFLRNQNTQTYYHAIIVTALDAETKTYHTQLAQHVEAKEKSALTFFSIWKLKMYICV